ncbi:hypothetical protein [Sporocytophaga myxococcoides]|uniref:hypothetical protein n=1 Tax=Sporocytophaga myxococcoides TaxID=153721 RepID=UPI0012DFD7DE|nr:hypothetical protein [Sporocytophaga myxococcoides]
MTTTIDVSPLNSFYKYEIDLPDERDLKFLKALQISNLIVEESDKTELKKNILSLKKKL